MRTVQVALVLQHLDEPTPRGILLIPSVPTLLKHSRDVQLFHEHGVIRRDEPRRELVLEVFKLPLDSALNLGNLTVLGSSLRSSSAVNW